MVATRPTVAEQQKQQKGAARKRVKGRHLSALKRARQTPKREARNQTVISTMRTYIKRVRTALVAKSKKEAEAGLKLALPYIARAVSKGVIHKKTAARYASRLMQAFNSLS